MDREDKLIDMRDRMNELIELLCTDRTLFSVCKCLILGEAIWLDEEEKTQNLLSYTYRLFSEHLKVLCDVWRQLDEIL